MNDQIRVLLVDDEPLAREKVRTLVKDDQEVVIIGECGNGRDAVEVIQSTRPDLLLLDVQMPGINGFGVLEAIKESYLPHVIFVTAYDQYAVRAFEVRALDYLLKPFDRERLTAAIERAKAQIRHEQPMDLDRRVLALLEQIKKPKYYERLIVKSGGRVFFLTVQEIEWIEAEGNYVSLHAAKKSYLLRETISSLELQLDPAMFIRIHRSAIVNINCIQELQTWTHGEFHVLLRDGTQLTLSRSYRDKLQSVLGNTL